MGSSLKGRRGEPGPKVERCRYSKPGTLPLFSPKPLSASSDASFSCREDAWKYPSPSNRSVQQTRANSMSSEIFPRTNFTRTDTFEKMQTSQHSRNRFHVPGPGPAPDPPNAHAAGRPALLALTAPQRSLFLDALILQDRTRLKTPLKLSKLETNEPPPLCSLKPIAAAAALVCRAVGIPAPQNYSTYSCKAPSDPNPGPPPRSSLRRHLTWETKPPDYSKPTSQHRPRTTAWQTEALLAPAREKLRCSRAKAVRGREQDLRQPIPALPLLHGSCQIRLGVASLDSLFRTSQDL